jgi:hypothetical protein
LAGADRVVDAGGAGRAASRLGHGAGLEAACAGVEALDGADQTGGLGLDPGEAGQVPRCGRVADELLPQAQGALRAGRGPGPDLTRCRAGFDQDALPGDDGEVAAVGVAQIEGAGGRVQAGDAADGAVETAERGGEAPTVAVIGGHRRRVGEQVEAGPEGDERLRRRRRGLVGIHQAVVVAVLAGVGAVETIQRAVAVAVRVERVGGGARVRVEVGEAELDAVAQPVAVGVVAPRVGAVAVGLVVVAQAVAVAVQRAGAQRGEDVAGGVVGIADARAVGVLDRGQPVQGVVLVGDGVGGCGWGAQEQ